LTFIFLFISPWSNKACRQDILGPHCPSPKVNGNFIFSLVFAGTGVRQPFPQNCASVISRVTASADSKMVSEMTFAFEFLFQSQLKFRVVIGLGILFQLCKSLVLLLLIPVQTNLE